MTDTRQPALSGQFNNGKMPLPSAPTELAFEAEDYLPDMEEFDLTEAQKRELLATLWDMMRMCIEMNAPAESWGRMVDAVIEGSAHESVDVD